jgi:uncharacterized repeat protein (TIGR01451 family)
MLNIKTTARRCTIDSLEERRLLSVTYGTNLVQNPGAENYDGTADGFNIITPKNWSAAADPTVARYRRDYGTEIGIRKPAFGGDAFFTGGPDTQTTDFFQTIDLSSVAADVDAGHVNFALSGQLGGFLFNEDNANVFVTFETADKSLLSRVDTGSVSASDRNDKTELLTRSTHGAVPASTRFALVQIHFKRDANSGYNDGFADNIALVLVTNTPSTVGITPTVDRSTLPTTAVSGVRTRGSLVLTLTNTSTSPNIGVDTISLLASTNGIVDSSSIPVATLKRGLGLGAGRSARFIFPVRNFLLPAGTYTLFVQTVDKYFTADNAAGPTIVVAAPVISLAATVGAVTPATVNAGQVIAFTLTLQNNGNVNSPGLASIAIGITPDGTTSSAPLRIVIVHLNLRAGGVPFRLRLRARIPAAQTTGTYQPFITLVQGANSTQAVGALPFLVN